jgi:hypothetical protein
VSNARHAFSVAGFMPFDAREPRTFGTARGMVGQAKQPGRTTHGVARADIRRALGPRRQGARTSL